MTKHRIRAKSIAALKAAGATPYAYIPDYAFLIHMNSTAAQEVQALAGVR